MQIILLEIFIKKEKLVFLFTVFLMLLAFSCDNPFATRNPEPPKNEQSTWIQPTSPNYVLANLRNAISEKNITNYMRCLADTSNSDKQFRYVAEPSVANANPGLFERWDKQDEFNYLNQLSAFVPKDSTQKASLTTLKENTFQDSVILFQSYELDVHYNCQEIDCIHDMEGQVEFRLVRTNEDLWYIYRWSDFSTGDNPTWSDLRAVFGK